MNATIEIHRLRCPRDRHRSCASTARRQRRRACGPDDCAPAVERDGGARRALGHDLRRVVRGAGRPDSGAAAAHGVDRAGPGAMRVGDLAEALGISQSTCSHHVKKLAEVGFVAVDKVGTASVVSVNPACCTGLPHAADVVMGTLAGAAVLPRGPAPRRVYAGHDRRRPRPRPRHLRRGRGHPQRHVRDQGPIGPQAHRQVAARAHRGWPRSMAPSSAGPRPPR